jgi:hypothetical protein
VRRLGYHRYGAQGGDIGVHEQDGVAVTVMAFDIAGGRIRNLCAVRNPDKLRPWTKATPRM